MVEAIVSVGRRGCSLPWKPITPSGGGARLLAVETNRPVEAVVAPQVKPDGGRSRLLSRSSSSKHGRGRA